MNRRSARPHVLLVDRSVTLLATVGRARAQPSVDSQPARAIKDLVYATVEEKPLALDLYLPRAARRVLLVWVHGGAWNTGSKAGVPGQLVRSGLAVASVDFRQASEARFPAQVHDIKAAIRFLRANRAHGYRADRIVIAGASSGAHLAALVGVTGINTGNSRARSGAFGRVLGCSGHRQLLRARRTCARSSRSRRRSG